MSRKKEQALQEFFTTQTELDAAINTPGQLYVIDAYPRWTGACKSICSTLKRIKLELSSPRLKFGTACIDELESLAEYRDLPPEPLFLFYAAGVLVDMCQGCNVPLLTSKIQTQVDNENAIEDGTMERKVYTVERPTTAVSHTSLVNSETDVTDVGSAEAKQLSFAFVTPIYIESAEAIKAKFKGMGIEILAERQHIIDKNEFIHIFPDIIDPEKFLSGDMFIDYIQSGTSVCFVLTREGEHGIGIIDQMLKVVGPSDQDTAKIEAPDSVNAMFGNTCMWAAVDAPMANRAINLLFEGFNAPTISARASAVNAASSLNNMVYAVFGECSEALQVQLQNYGCQMVQPAAECAEEQLASIPEEMRETSKNMMVISCAKSLANMRSFCETAGEPVFIVECAQSRPASASGEGADGERLPGAEADS